jgi:hypothetical protein
MRPIFTAPLAALLALAAAGVAAAQPAPQPQSPEAIAKVYACAAIADPAQRLACYDAAVGAMKTAESQGEFAAVDAAGVRQIEREAFGFSLPSLPRLALPSLRRGNGTGTAAAPVERTAELSMTIARVGRFDGRQSFVMDNGQVWVLLDSQGNRLARPGAAVTVKRASLGSYLMSVEAGGAALRVRRAE